jgi:tyrosyl-tRNA synthetase
MKDFIEELRWRGMLHDVMPGTQEQLNREMTVGYVGIDPTADSLHIGHLVSVMLLKHLQLCGHKPLALIGGATGMIGDPSGKSEERNLLSEEALRHNEKCIGGQLSRFLDFGPGATSAEIVNNYDWFGGMNFLSFLRDVGKHITVSYMMAKDSVQKRLETGISFTEFTYQLVQGYDFYYLYKNKGCRLQMGGSDQWGNIVTGTELIRRKDAGEAFALTSPLITKADGSKFGKTESGNIWLDPKKTSPYRFYQFWLNCTDEDSLKYARIFTLLTEEEISDLSRQHNEAPHLRLLQRTLAKDLTVKVHSGDEYKAAEEASEILFGKGTEETLRSFDEAMLLSVLEGVPRSSVSKSEIESGIQLIELLADKTNIFPSRGEARKMIQSGGVSINKKKMEDVNAVVSAEHLLNSRYILAQKGKKNYHLIIVS